MEENNSKVKQADKSGFLDEHIFSGLIDRNDGFDSETINYFSEADFAIVLKRIEKNELGILGIEPWLNREFYAVAGFEDYGGIHLIQTGITRLLKNLKN